LGDDTYSGFPNSKLVTNTNIWGKKSHVKVIGTTGLIRKKVLVLFW